MNTSYDDIILSLGAQYDVGINDGTIFKKVRYIGTKQHFGKPMLCFGVVPYWPGVAELCLIPDKKKINEHKIKLYGQEYNLINGDDDDLRFLDTNNSIVLLKYKETRASQEDINNFVVDIDDLPRNVELT